MNYKRRHNSRRYSRRRSGNTRRRSRSHNSSSRRRRRQYSRYKGGVLTSTRELITHLSSPPTENLVRFFKTICSKAHFCLSFGRENYRLNNFFDFTSFKYVRPPLTQISSGANGMTTELIYERNGYKASAILKTTIAPASDNLFLEAYNGLKYVNVFNRYFPCFLETYGAYQYKNNFFGMMLKRELAENKEANISPDTLKDTLVPIKTIPPLYDSQPLRIFNNNGTAEYLQSLFAGFDATKPLPKIYNEINAIVANSCKYAHNNAILIQHIHNPILFGKWFAENRRDPIAYNVELPQILFQIYSALAQLNTMHLFTHYDLHSYNVLLYEIPDGKCITMVYKNGPYDDVPEISFKTRYIAKIIDYGRSYLPDNAQIYKLVCMQNERTCESTYYTADNAKSRLKDPYNRICGDRNGYGFVDLEGDNASDYYINRVKLNNAHDLRLIVSFANNRNIAMSQGINNILNNVARSFTIRPGVRPQPNGGVPSKMITTTPADFKFGADEGLTHPIQTVQELYWTLYNYIAGPKVGSKGFYGFNGDDVYSSLVEYATLTVDLTINNPNPMLFIISEGQLISPMPTPSASPTPSTPPMPSAPPMPRPLVLPSSTPTKLTESSIPKPFVDINLNTSSITRPSRPTNIPNTPNMRVTTSIPSINSKSSGDSLWNTWNMSGINSSHMSAPSYDDISA